MRIEKLASVSALGMIAAVAPSTLPSTAAGAAVAAIAAAGIAVMFIYNLYEHFEAKKHAEELERIERLYQEYLAKISIQECNIVAGFPPIFQKNEDGQYQAMSMTDAQVNSIARNSLRAPTNIELVTYRHHIICAIAALKKYYFLHDDKSGLTVQVILYLLNILEKLLQFEGYAFDIAYLNALCNFICTYASTKGEKSEHFTCLNPVFRHLQYATQKLIQHKETRSQEEMIAELRGTCMFYIDHSIRSLSKFLIPYSEWHLIDCCDPYPLRDGIYTAEYITRIIGPARWTHSQQTLPTECSLTTHVRQLTKYYLQTIDSSHQPTLPSQTQLTITIIPEHVLENMHNVFEAHPDKNPAKDLNHVETQQIISALAQFSKLIHSMISFLYFLNELTKMIKNLGTSETDNPAHCKRLYELHQVLSDSIEEQAESALKLFHEINRRNDNQMRIAEKERFLRELMQMLNEIKININTQSDAIRERRKTFNKKHITITEDTAPREHMADVVNRVEIACNLTLPKTPNGTPSSTRPESTQSIRITPIPTPPQIRRQPSQGISADSSRNTAPRAPITPPTNFRQTHTAPTIAPQNAKLFPKSYDLIYEKAKTKSPNAKVELLYLMLEMMDDYTKDNSRAQRILHGSFFHHHLNDASTFSKNLKQKINGLGNAVDDSIKTLIHEQLQLLSNITKKPGTNQNGSFATRVSYIFKKCQENGIVMQTEIPRLAI